MVAYISAITEANTTTVRVTPTQGTQQAAAGIAVRSELVGSRDVTLDEVLIEPRLLARFYVFNDWTSVLEALQTDHNLIPIIWEAHSQIRKHFPQARILLEVVNDPEVLAPPEVQITIVPSSIPEETLAGFRQLSNEWWRHHFASMQGRLALTIEYR